MADYTRPNSQWQDLPRSSSALTAWHLVYTEDGDEGTVTLASGRRRRLGTGLVLTDEVIEADGSTTQTYSLVPQVNGEIEAQVAYSHNVVYITG